MLVSLLLVSVIATVPSASSKAAALPVLNAPSSLKTGNMNEESVVLEWDFKEPDNLSLSEVVFRVSLEREQPLRRHYDTKPLRHTFENLNPGKVYTASVVATASNWLDGPPAQISFTTLEKDWTTPRIRSVIKTPRRDIAQYSVTWFELSLSSLSHVVVEVCDSPCVNYTEEARAVSIPVPVKFDSKFVVRVCALYSVDVVGPIERCSNHFQGISAEAPPEKLLNMRNVRKVGNRIQLDWHPILPLDGPRSYYEIYVRDPNKRNLKPEFGIERQDFKVSLAVLGLSDTDFELRFIDEEFERWLRQKSFIYKFECDAEQSDPECFEQNEPLQLKIMRKTKRTLRFKILFQTGVKQSSWFATPPRHLHLRPDNFTFTAYKPIEFLVRSCLTYSDDSMGICGNITASRIINGVDAPSPVSSVGYEFRSVEEFEVYWQAPEDPRGPIDGYKLQIQREYRDGLESEVVTLAPHLRSCVIKDPTGEAQYKIGIAAFNVDRVNDNLEYPSKLKYVIPVRSKSNPLLWIFSMGVFAAVIISEVVFLRRRNRERDQDQEPVKAEMTMVSLLKRFFARNPLNG